MKNIIIICIGLSLFFNYKVGFCNEENNLDISNFIDNYFNLESTKFVDEYKYLFSDKMTGGLSEVYYDNIRVYGVIYKSYKIKSISKYKSSHEFEEYKVVIVFNLLSYIANEKLIKIDSTGKTFNQILFIEKVNSVYKIINQENIPHYNLKDVVTLYQKGLEYNQKMLIEFKDQRSEEHKLYKRNCKRFEKLINEMKVLQKENL